MKGILFTAQSMRILDENGIAQTTIKPGELVDALWCASRWYRDNGCPALADYYCEKTTAVMRTQWYQDWALSL